MYGSLQLHRISAIRILIACALFVALIPPISVEAAPRISSTPTDSPSPSPTPLKPPEPPTTGINLTLSPPFINVVTDPGVPVSSQLKIRNNSNLKEYLKVSLAKFKSGVSGDRPVLQPVTPDDEFVKWISFSEESFTVDINEQKTIKFTISPPKDASLGYYYAVLVQRIEEKGLPGQQTLINGAPAFLVILEVRSPNAKKELQLIDFRTSSRFYEYPPVDFLTKFSNTGNIHNIPFGDIFIDGWNQPNISRAFFNEYRGNILPDTNRVYRSSWNDSFISLVPKMDNGNPVRDKNGATVYETKIDWSKIDKIRIGKYTAHLVAVYDNGQRDVPMEASVSFWIIPWKILGGILIISLILLYGIKSMVSALLHKLLKLSKKK